MTTLLKMTIASMAVAHIHPVEPNNPYFRGM